MNSPCKLGMKLIKHVSSANEYRFYMVLYMVLYMVFCWFCIAGMFIYPDINGYDVLHGTNKLINWCWVCLKMVTSKMLFYGRKCCCKPAVWLPKSLNWIKKIKKVRECDYFWWVDVSWIWSLLKVAWYLHESQIQGVMLHFFRCKYRWFSIRWDTLHYWMVLCHVHLFWLA